MGLAAIAASLGAAVAWPARAEDSGFWDVIRSMSRGGQSFAPAPSWFPQPRFRRAAPKRAARPAPEVARLPEKPPADLTPPDPAKRPNPLATLLNDPTLRNGDIVMFPDGPRVFRGAPGTRHAMAAFVQVSRAKDMAASTRKTVAALPVGENNAWSSAAATAKGQIAQGAADVETTGSVTRGRARR
jgi:hypothetical protein